MPDPVWYRSLYWRFAFGFVALLATLLVVQGVVFLWMTGRMAELFPTRLPTQFAQAMAAEIETELKDRPDADLKEFVTDNYARAFRSFVIVMRDGRVAPSERVPPTPMMIGAARRRLGLDRGPGPGQPPGSGRGGPGWAGPPPPSGGRPDARSPDGRGADGRGADAFGRGGDGYGRGGRGGGGGGYRGDGRGGPPQGFEFASVYLDNNEVGLVVVSIDPPPLSVAMRDLGPTLAIVALGLLIAGTSVAALVVFRPAKRRLQDLQQAAIALGAGASGVRAQESGGDEVTSLARAFNDMAGRLEERTSALEDADRTRRQLLADVSHELTTPLAAIRGYVETLGMQTLAIDEPTRARYLGIVTEETERLEHIVGDLLDLAKLEGGGSTLKLEPVSIAQLFERIQRRHEPAVQRKHIELRTIVGDDAQTVTGDQNRLEQALQNLVANATRHTPDGGRIVVEACRVENSIRLSVEDTGPGIPPEHLARVFGRFYKVDVSRTGTMLPSGSGLGLSIVQAIVTRHGGTVTASNLPQGGARFEVVLPV